MPMETMKLLPIATTDQEILVSVLVPYLEFFAIVLTNDLKITPIQTEFQVNSIEKFCEWNDEFGKIFDSI